MLLPLWANPSYRLRERERKGAPRVVILSDPHLLSPTEEDPVLGFQCSVHTKELKLKGDGVFFIKARRAHSSPEGTDTQQQRVERRWLEKLEVGFLSLHFKGLTR